MNTTTTGKKHCFYCGGTCQDFRLGSRTTIWQQSIKTNRKIKEMRVHEIQRVNQKSSWDLHLAVNGLKTFGKSEDLCVGGVSYTCGDSTGQKCLRLSFTSPSASRTFSHSDAGESTDLRAERVPAVESPVQMGQSSNAAKTQKHKQM